MPITSIARLGLLILIASLCARNVCADDRLLMLSNKVWRVSPEGKVEPFSYTFNTAGNLGIAGFGSTLPLPSPDSRWIVFGRNNNLYLFNVDSGRERRLTEYGKPYTNEYASVEVLATSWSTDSNRILFAVVPGETDCADCEHDWKIRKAPYGFYTHDVKLAKTLPLAMPEGFKFSAWLPDGRLLGRVTAVNTKPCEEKLAVFVPGEGHANPVTAPLGSPEQMDVSTDGRWAVANFGAGCEQPQRAQLIKIELNRWSAAPVTSLASWAEYQQPHFSPLADHIAYIHQHHVYQGIPNTDLVVDGESLYPCPGYLNYQWVDERRIGVSCQDEVLVIDIVTRLTVSHHVAKVKRLGRTPD